MDERAFVRRLFAQALAANARQSHEDMPWAVMQRCAESLPEAVRGGGRPLDMSIHLLEAILEGFPATLPDDPAGLHDNAVHALAVNLLKALRKAKDLEPGEMDGMHRLRLDAAADTLRRMGDSLREERPEEMDRQRLDRLAHELTELGKTITYALRDVSDTLRPG